jgi:hypothetical protein
MPSPVTLTLRSSPFSLPTNWRQLTLALLLGGATVAQAQTQSQTPFGKNDSGTYLFQANNTKGYNLNFTTGSTTSQGDNNGQGGSVYVPTPGGTAAKLNAAGFNYADGYIWTQNNGTNQLVRVGTEFVGKAYSFTQPAGYSQTIFTVGDVDVTGKMYMTRGGSDEGSSKAITDVYIIDLMLLNTNPQNANPLTATELTFPYRSYITDWAFSPKDTCIYAINTYFNNSALNNNENSTKIYRFVTHRRKFNGVVSEAGTRETLGVATGGSTAIAPANFAAAFMDSNGSFYVVASGSGLVHRIDRPDLLPAVADASGASTSIPATYIGKFTSGIDLNTDGARNAFSRPVSGALPVQLTAFSATAIPSRGVRLDWATASEVNNDYFEVQRSPDGRSFEVAGRVRGHGSSLQAHAYSLVDAAPGAATTHYYRLRQVDHDGTSSFSPVQVVALGPGAGAFQLAAVPNPTTAGTLQVQVQYAGPTATAAVLTMRSLLGQTVFAQPVTLQPGTTTLAPAAPLAPGMYWLSLSGEATPGAQGTKVLITN